MAKCIATQHEKSGNSSTTNPAQHRGEGEEEETKEDEKEEEEGKKETKENEQ